MDAVEIPGGRVLFKLDRFPDRRGSFREIYNKDRYGEHIPIHEWVQINHSTSKKRTIRGLHYRENEAKLITVIKGTIWDITVDIKPESPTFGQWSKFLLNCDYQLYIPAGFAHGFEVISSTDAEVVYYTNKTYDPSLSKGLAWNDPTLNIRWYTKHPRLSKQDGDNPSWKDIESNIGQTTFHVPSTMMVEGPKL